MPSWPESSVLRSLQHPEFLQFRQVAVGRGQRFGVVHRLADLVDLLLEAIDVHLELLQSARIQLGGGGEAGGVLWRPPGLR